MVMWHLLLKINFISNLFKSKLAGRAVAYWFLHWTLALGSSQGCVLGKDTLVLQCH